MRHPPLGYDVRDRKLIVNEVEAEAVRAVFKRFVRLGSATKLAQALRAEGVTTKPGNPIDKGYVYRLLSNRVYIGEAVHKGESYPGEHEAIVTRKLWDQAHAILQDSPRQRAAKSRAETPALLKGLIYGPGGVAMTPTHTRRRGRLYRYYITMTILKQGAGTCPLGRVPAAEVERAVVDQLRRLLAAPELIVGTWRAARPEIKGLTESDVRDALTEFEAIWDELFPAEQARIVQLLVERVDVGLDGLELRLRTEGLCSLIDELRAAEPAARTAA